MKAKDQTPLKDKRKHNNKRENVWFTLPSNVIPPNFGTKGKKKLK